MRTETTTRNIYTYEESSKELKEKIREYFANSYGHFEHYLEERIETLKKLADRLYCNLNYSISCVPDRGEHITMTYKGYDDRDMLSYLAAFISNKKDCPLTGVYYDEDIKYLIKKYSKNAPFEYDYIEAVNYALDDYLEDIHKEYEHTLSDEYISDLCEANEYEFYDDGTIA